MIYGSCYARKVDRKKGKVWEARIKYKETEKGKWKDTSKVLPNCKGKREAYKLAEEWKEELIKASSLSPTFDKGKTVSEVVRDYMDYQLQCGELEQSTYHSRLYTYKSLVDPYIGNISFITLTRPEIIGWLTKLNAKGLSQGTIGLAFYTVRKTYNYYCELGELVRNPFLGVKPPKKGNAKVTHMTKEQMDHFIKCLDNEDPKFRLACYLAFYAGLRRGEICGLRWRDIDLDLGIISINSAIGIGETKYTKQPKNKSSIRTFPIVPQLLKELKENVGEPKHFVVGKGTEFMSPFSLAFKFKRFVNANKIIDAYGKPITLHALRHNLGAVGIASGMDIASLSKMMGHSNRSMTLDTYGDATKDAMIVATDKLGKKFKG